MVAGLPANLLSQLQVVMNAGARLIFNAIRREHVTSVLRQLHCFSVPERITFKLATLMFQCVNGTAPGYPSANVRRVADVPGRKHLRSAVLSSLAIPATDVLQLVIAPSSSQPPLSGTSSPKKSDLPHHYLFSDVD